MTGISRAQYNRPRADRRAGAFVMAAAALCAAAAEPSADSFDLSAYYPAPSGVYNTLSTTGSAYWATQSGNVGIFTAPPSPIPAASAVTGQSFGLPGPLNSVLDVNGTIQTEGPRFIVNGFDQEGMFWFKTLAGVNLDSGERGTVFLGARNGVNGNGIDAVYITAMDGVPADGYFGLSVLSPTAPGCSGLGGFGPTNADCIFLGRVPFVDEGNSPLPLSQTVPRLQSWGEFFTNHLSANVLYVSGRAPLPPNGYAAYIGGATSIDGALDIDGVVTSNAPSDARLKKNIAPVAGALEKVSALSPVRFEWKDDFAAERHLGSGTQWGLLAQDVEKVLPELVGEDAKGYKRLEYGPELNMLTLAAIKELKAEGDALQAAIDRREKEIADLEAEVKTLRGN